MRSVFIGAPRVPGGMRQCALLRNQQQENQYIMNIPAGHGKGRVQQDFCDPPHAAKLAHRNLLGDRHHRIGEPIIKPHRIVPQHGQPAGQQDGFKAVFHRSLGLHFN